MNRRDILTSALKMGTMLSVGAGGFVAPSRARATTAITVVGYGGSAEDVEKKYWIEPFTAETGISVIYAAGPNLASAKAQVDSKNILWDVYAGSDYTGEKEGLWEPIDATIIDPARFIQTLPAWGVPDGVYAGGIAYDPSRVKQPPKDFAQFWDVKNFPGRRALPNSPTANLEMALIADGVAPKELYPLDVERAFYSLDRIKPYVTRWFDATPQGVSLFQRHEVDYIYTYANRVSVANKDGVSIEISLDQCLILPEYRSVLRGSPRKEAAMRYLEFITRPEHALTTSNIISHASLVKGVNERLSEQTRRWIPDLNSPKHVFFDYQYWGDHSVQLTRRFKEWMLT